MTAVDDVVQIRDLTKTYGSLAAVDGVSLTVRRGEVFGFLGPNGAGKTTTLRMLLGLIRPTSGTVSVLGRAAGDPKSLRRIGSLIEGPGFYPYLTGGTNLRTIARYAGVPASGVGPALEAVGLADRAGDKFGSYSLGMKQRLGVAAALLKDPELVILDEPTNGLDPQGMRDMRELIVDLGRQGRTVILSSHLMGEVQQICERVAVIDRGRIVSEGTVEQLRGETELELVATPSDTALATLRALTFVERVRVEDGRLLVSVGVRHTAEITRALVHAGVSVTGVRRAERELEDVFFDLTTHHDGSTDQKELSHV
ncbi:ABC-2 type transport system ATP-binding protein [Pedococcus dokdonensis]|uniref:ABC-2 type transport system ATP-binding protein n=1 Tax=Pedococcus dokdonensis TaxID=443156 RepID=A0A1H0UER1_9MICO|nr:ABC transporter ATP-binding protein [Pedococcus dokdonensis]SDP64560.1 ABC-2 type transport system ATP-binding protein [Pedococcus dokdonensis]